ncbi:MAG: hypothetical protein JSU61_14080 [Fidelibacterota bacterium]|nr:MAG: hypothetical protein JSU61_14080 [Candidatus Neomarinimicrobiota bacterium]
MSRESRVIISRLIVVAVFMISIAAMALGNFFITLITVSGGLIFWLLYLLAAGLGPSAQAEGTETPLGKSLSKVVAGLGGILAISAFITYGMEQTMWGEYSFNVAGLALGLAILVVMLMPLFVIELTGKPRGPIPPAGETQIGEPSAAPSPPPPATTMPESQIYYGTPYPEEDEPYEYDEEDEYESEGEDWEEEEEYEEDAYEMEDEDEDEDEDQED